MKSVIDSILKVLKRNSTSELPDDKSILEDKPVAFGYKCLWIAVKTINQQDVAKEIGLSNVKKSNWGTGITKAYEGLVFITPPVGGWILVVGAGLPNTSSKERIKIV